MDRLSALDAEFLHLEDSSTHLHIAGALIFDGPTPAFDAVRDLMNAKLHLIPRYRQRVRSVPLELGRPVWCDDPHFRLDYHLRHTALPTPGGDGELCALMSRIVSQPLDRERPLWEAWVVEGLDEQRWAFICKVHHCLVDGMSGVDLLSVLLDLEPHASLPEAKPWEPSPEPDGVHQIADAWGGLGDDLVDRAKGLVDAVLHPGSVVETAKEFGAGLVNLARGLQATPPLAISGDIGPHRNWRHCSVSLDDVRTIRAAFGGTVNDVVLAVITGGYRALLAHLGDDPDSAVVRSLVPVSTRSDDEHGIPDNRVSVILYELPVGEADPVARVALVHEQMLERKASHTVEAGSHLVALSNLAPPPMLGFVSRSVQSLGHRLPQRMINTVTTNVPGPQFPLYCLGSEMLEYHPFVPITTGMRVGTAILSYNGWLSIGVSSDFDSVPDTQAMVDGIARDVSALLSAAGAAWWR